MAAGRQWIRLDVDFEDSDWLVDLDPLAQFAWVKFCCRVKAEGANGRWRKRSVTALRRRLALPEAAVAEMLAAATAGDSPALEEQDGEWVVGSWEKYYPTDRTNADRQRRYRERKKVEEPDGGDDDNNGGNAVTLSCATVDVRRNDGKATDEQMAQAPIVENSRDRILGAARHLGFQVDSKMAGMVSRWLGNGKREADVLVAIEGLSMLYVDGKLEPPKDLRPLYAKDSARMWAWCEQRHNDQQKRHPRIGGATPATVLLGRPS
jgi:hypothetical protein